MKKMYLMCLSILLLTITAYAQTTITGTVRDATGETLPAVSIKIKGTQKSTSSDANGKFSISTTPNDVLVFSYVGFKVKEVNVGNATNLNVSLESSTNDLAEVEVNVALGLKRPKKEITYAVSQIEGKDIVHAGTNNLGSALVGKLAGVEVGNMSGGPMAGTRIEIRGMNTLDGSNRPLLVLDGVPVSDNDDAYQARGANNGFKGSLLNSLNPDDIASMTVLRGANAAAIYGSQALGGAIVITTKKGNAGVKGLGIDFSTNYTVNQVTDLPELQNEYGNGELPYFATMAADGVTPIWTSTSTVNFGPKLDGRNVQWWDGVVRPWVAQPDNYKDLFQNGYTNNNNISFNGANENGSFRLSASNNNYNGFLKNMEQTRNSITFAGSYNLSKKLKVEAQIIYNNIFNQNPPQRIDRASNYPLPRNEITSLYKENYKNDLGYYQTTQIATISGNLRDNILRPLFWDQLENRYTSSQQQFLSSITGTYTINDIFTLRLRGGTNRYFNLNEVKERWLSFSNPTNPENLQGTYARGVDQNYRNYGEALLMINKKLGNDFKVNVNLGASIDDSYNYTNNISTRGLRFNDIFSFANNKTLIGYSFPGNFRSGERYKALFASATVNFKDYLFMDLTARNDWSSKLPDYSRSYFYPSVGFSFILSDAAKLPDFINHAKLRTSYAVVGNTVPSTYFSSEAYVFGNYLQGDGTTSAVTGTIPASVPPNTIIAEQNRSFEFGLESSYFKSRVNLDVTYFYNRGFDLISAAVVPPSSGASSKRGNNGSLSNRGIEVTLGADVIRSNNFSWHADLNYSRIKRKVNSLGDPANTQRVMGNLFGSIFRSDLGASPFDIYMYKFQRDANGQLIVRANGTVVPETQLSNMGSSLPKFYGGFNNRLTYKNFDLQVMLSYRFGGKVVSYTNSYLKATGSGTETMFGRDAEHGGLPFYVAGGVNVPYTGQAIPTGSVLRHDGMIVDGVKANGQKNDIIISAATYYNSRYGGTATEDQVYKNDYIYLSEVSLNYTLPKTMLAKIGLQNISVGLIGRNLAWIYKSLPNVSAFSTFGTSGANAAFEYTSYPNARNIGFSLKAKF